MEGEMEIKVKKGMEARSTSILRALADLFMEQRKGEEDKLSSMKEKFFELKSKSVGNRKELVKEAMDSLEDNGCEVYYAESKDDVVSYLRGLVSKEDIVAKSKSNTIKELKLVDELSKDGIEVIETDFGDRIIQLSGETPGHPIGPALHLPVDRVAEVFSREMNVDIEPDPEAIVRAGIEGLREKIASADVGLTGANAIAAREGAISLIENEGNISLLTRLPEKHIAIAGVDKVVPTIEDALFQTLVTEAYSGIEGTYISLIKGPSRTADISAKEVIGVYGAKEVHIIFVDHWREEADEKGFGEMLNCVNCGSCLAACPVVYSVGLEFGENYPGGIGISKSMFVDGLDKAAKRGLWLCNLCRRCMEFCPSDIDVSRTIEKIRAPCLDRGLYIPGKIGDFLENIRNLGNPYGYPIKERGKWAEGSDIREFTENDEFLYYIGCVASYDSRAQGMARSLGNLLNRANLSFGILGPKENCDGNAANRLGEKGLFEILAKRNVDQFAELGAEKIVTLSPHSYNSMKNEYPEFGGNLEVLHYTQLLKDLVKSGKLNFSINAEVTFHDPCFLGRYNEEYEAPREILESVPGIELVEMGKNREDSLCCGGGAGNFYTDFLGRSEYSPARVRVKEAYETGAEILAVACPICLTMFEDAVSAEGLDGKIEVKDISEIAEAAFFKKG